MEYFSEKWTTIPMSSFGMVYKHLGKEFIRKIQEAEFPEDTLDDEQLDSLYSHLYKVVIMSIDANNQRVSQIQAEKFTPDMLNYTFTNNLETIVGGFNASRIMVCESSHSQVKNAVMYVQDAQVQDFQFQKAVIYVQVWLQNSFFNALQKEIAYFKDLQVFLKAFNSRQNKEILVLGEKFSFWRMLSKNDPSQQIKFIVNPRSSCEYSVLTVNPKGQRFVNLVNILPEEEARKVLKDELKFVHKACFIGIAHSQEGAVKLAQISLDEHYRITNRVKRVSTSVQRTFKQNRVKLATWVLGGAAGLALGWYAAKK